MSKFNKPVSISEKIQNHPAATINHAGGLHFNTDAEMDLYLKATVGFLDDKYYQKSDQVLKELREAISKVDRSFVLKLANYARNKMNLRSIPMVLLAEAAHAVYPNESPNSPKSIVKEYVPKVVKRADEINEVLAYSINVIGKGHKAKLANSLKKGVALAFNKFDEYQFAKYNRKGAITFKDALRLVHPKAKTEEQQILFKKIKEDSLATPNTWEVVISGEGSTAENWNKIAPDMGIMACFSEDTPIWLPDGTTETIKNVVTNKLNVLSYDKEWDIRPVKYGPGQKPRDISVGNLKETAPIDFIENGDAEVFKITMRSGRVIEATSNHKWVTRRRTGLQTWEWKETSDLQVGDQIPTPINATFFGDVGTWKEGYIIGAMLGDGGLTNSPELSFDWEKKIGTFNLVKEYAESLGCVTKMRPEETGTGPRARFSDNTQFKNNFTEMLRSFGVWGQVCGDKSLPNKPYSRDFIKGCLSGLIDTDGSVMLKSNNKGYAFIQISFGSTSQKLAQQTQDMFLKMGVLGNIRKIQKEGAKDFYLFEINDVASIRKAHGFLNLQNKIRRENLDSVFTLLEKQTGKKVANSWKCAYDPSLVIDKIKSIVPAGIKKTYCVTVPNNLFIVNGLVVGNCVRNLRNMEQKGAEEALKIAYAALRNPEHVLKSRLLPFRFYAAAREVTRNATRDALNAALDISVANLPKIKGNVAVFADTSGSMGTRVSDKSTISCLDIATLFGAMTTNMVEDGYDYLSCAFATDTNEAAISKRDSVLTNQNKIQRVNTNGCGTEAWKAFPFMSRKGFKADVVVIFSDMQCYGADRNLATEWAKYKQANPKAVLVSVHLNGYGGTQFPPNSKDVITLSGWSESILSYIASYQERHSILDDIKNNY